MKYRFEIIYQPLHFKQASALMRKLDLDIGEVGIHETFLFTTKENIEVSIIKEKLLEVFKLSGLELLNIEGGKVE